MRAPVFDEMAPDLIAGLQATSRVASLTQNLHDIADVVYDMASRGDSRRDIDRRVHSRMEAAGLDCETRREEVEQELAGTPFERRLDLHKLWLVYRAEERRKECIRSIAFMGEPSPFLPFAADYWIEDPNSEPAQLVAVMTPLTDPRLAAKQLVEKHAKVFGKVASGRPRKNEEGNARKLAMHRAGMGYREIAIQNLREKHPEIVRGPGR